MKKKAYRTTKINHAVTEKLCADCQGREVIVGIDVAKVGLFAAFLIDGQEVRETVKWNHPVETPRFLELLESLEAKRLDVVLEPTGTYGEALRYQLLARRIKVFRVNAKSSSDAKEIYDGVHSTHDAKAAAIIAWLHLVKPCAPWPMDSEDSRELKAAIRQVHHFDDQYHRALNKLEAELARFWPELTSILELTTVTLQTLLDDFGGPAALCLDEARAVEVMLEAGRSRLSRDKVKAVVLSARNTLGVPQLELEREVVSALAHDALRARQESQKAKATLEQRSMTIAEVEAMSSVVGKTTAAVLFSKIGPPQAFTSASAFEKSCGLNLREYSSGRHQGTPRISKRGSGVARKYLYLAVLRMLQTDSLMQQWYEKKIKRDGGLKSKAIVALMRKLLRALWHVAQGSAYDNRLLFDVQRLSSRAAA